jgi:DNA-binding GntR family transcriptional regulator
MENHTTHGAKGKLNNLAYEQLKEMIITGEVSHDKPIVERAISQKLNMSRTPIKHALSRLQQEGLIRIVPRHGVFPVVITYPEYQHILEIREVLEGLAARLAVDHFSNADLRELRFIFENLGDIRDIKKVGHQKFALANVAFHRKILETSNNPKLIETVGSLYDHLSLVRLKTIELTGRRNRSVDEHEAILKALEQRDADRSETAMRSHIRTIKKDIEAAVKKNPGVFPNNTVLSDSLGSIADT